MDEQDQRTGGPDVLDAFVYGEDLLRLKMAALDRARELYGPDAQLQIERVGTIRTSSVLGRPPFCTNVRVRCLNLPEEDK
jgi:hypothetical protein